MKGMSLPIDQVIPEAIAALRDRRALILSAPPGTGKTTRFPDRLLNEPWLKQRILLVQPRRVAARAAARRIAMERGSPLGGEVGYHVRLDKKISRDTRLIALTPGILLRQLLDDPFLEGVSCVLFDEAHERGLESDLAMAMVALARTTVRPDLAIGILSATLETDRFAKWLEAPIVVATAPMFPVEIRYASLQKDRPWLDQVARHVRLLASETSGDVLVFLPGVGEIQRLDRLLNDVLGVDILPLHGELDPEKQDLALSRGIRRRIVLATNVAESSVTVDGVRVVVDTGMARSLVHDPSTGLDRLELGEISKASADQRAGRSGRQGPGICLRLWSLENHKSRFERTAPEILKLDLSGTLLLLLHWNGCPVSEIPWLEPPSASALIRARETLASLGALQGDGLSPLGSRMAQIPMDPRLARMLLESASLGVAPEGAISSALLTERNPFGRLPREGIDFFQEVDTLRLWAGMDGAVDHGLLLNHRDGQYLDRIAGLFLKQAGISVAGVTPLSDWEEGLAKAMVAGFPDRVAKLREGGRRRAVMVGGRSIRLEVDLPGKGELFLALEVEDSQTESRARKFLPIEQGWLPQRLLSEKIQTGWNNDKTELLAEKQFLFQDLVLREHPVRPEDPVALARLLAERAWEKRAEVLPLPDSSAGQFLQRLAILAKACPEMDMPIMNDLLLKNCLTEMVQGRKSLEQVREGEWLEAFLSHLDWAQRQALEEEAPAKVTLPNGRTASIVYEEGKAPVLGARIQDFFGWDKTPTIAKKRVKLLLHLLAPNGRVQQITDDLPGFWRGSYALVRKDMKGRYPKHPWPEDPWTSDPVVRKGPKPRPT